MTLDKLRVALDNVTTQLPEMGPDDFAEAQMLVALADRACSLEADRRTHYLARSRFEETLTRFCGGRQHWACTELAFYQLRHHVLLHVQFDEDDPTRASFTLGEIEALRFKFDPGDYGSFRDAMVRACAQAGKDTVRWRQASTNAGALHTALDHLLKLDEQRTLETPHVT